MKPSEAADLVTLLAAATSTRMLTQEIEVWEEQLRPLDAEIATRAVHYGREHLWRRLPPWKDFREVYFMLRRQLQEPVGEQRADLPPAGKRGVEAPEWVWVWSWANWRREPRNLRPFPQQKGHTDDALLMSEEEYEKLLEEWIAAGKPKATRPLPMLKTRAMT